MSDTRLFLVRHGETTDNSEQRLIGWKDPPLSDRGLRQARAVGRALSAFAPLDAIYTSDLDRAHSTARAIAEESGYPGGEIRSTANLREQNFGVLDGLTYQAAERDHTKSWQSLFSGPWDAMIPEGESNAEVAARAEQALNAALQSHKGGVIVIVSHLITLSHLLRLLLEVPREAFPRVAFWVQNGGIHQLRQRNELTWWVESLNRAHHLASIE